MKKLYILLFILISFSGSSVFAQVKIGDSGSSAQSTILDLNNTQNLGLLLNKNGTIPDTAVSNPTATVHYFGGNLFLSQSGGTAGKWNVISPWIFNGDTANGVSFPTISRSGVGIGVNTLDASYNPTSSYNYPANLHIGLNSKNITTGGSKIASITLGDYKDEIAFSSYPVLLIDNDEILVKQNGGSADTLRLQELSNGKVQVGKDATNTSDFNVSGKIKENGGFIQPSKSIIMWDGTVVTGTNFNASGLGVGEMSGWAICNGSNATPNLTGMFIRGSGDRTRVTRNSAGTNTTGVLLGDKIAGATGGLDDELQSAAQVGAHNHASGTLSANGSGGHSHSFGTSYVDVNGGPINDGVANGDGLSNTGYSYATNNNGGHSHTVNTGSTAMSTTPTQKMPNHPSYYVVIYLMKL